MERVIKILFSVLCIILLIINLIFLILTVYNIVSSSQKVGPENNTNNIIIENQTIITKLLMQNTEKINRMWIEFLTTDELKEYYNKLEPDNKQKEIKHDDKRQ